MRNYTKTERQNYIAHRQRVCNELNITVNDYNYFRRLNNDYNKLFTDNCNGVMDEYSYWKQFNHLNAVLISRMARMNRFDINHFIQTDPRGASVYLSLEAMSPMNYTNGHCIY